MPRKGSTVTFDTNDQNSTRRHSSPAPGLKKKETLSQLSPIIASPTDNSRSRENDWFYSNQQYNSSTYRKKSAGDQSLMSMVIDENDGDEDEDGNGSSEKDEVKKDLMSEKNKVQQNNRRGKNNSWATSSQQSVGRRMTTVIPSVQQPKLAPKRRLSLWQVVQESMENSDDTSVEPIYQTPFNHDVNKNINLSPSNRKEPLNRNMRSDSIFTSFLKNKFVKQGMKFNLISNSLDRHDLYDKVNDDADKDSTEKNELKKEDLKNEESGDRKDGASRFSLFANSILSSIYGKSPEKESSSHSPLANSKPTSEVKIETTNV